MYVESRPVLPHQTLMKWDVTYRLIGYLLSLYNIVVLYLRLSPVIHASGHWLPDQRSWFDHWSSRVIGLSPHVNYTPNLYLT